MDRFVIVYRITWRSKDFIFTGAHARSQLWFNTLMPLKSNLRSAIYQTEKIIQRTRFSSVAAPEMGWPILLGISFPKSGTHLLDQILLGFNKIAPFSRRLHSFYAEYEGESGRRRSLEQALGWLDSLRPGDITSAHLFAREEVIKQAYPIYGQGQFRSH